MTQNKADRTSKHIENKETHSGKRLGRRELLASLGAAGIALASQSLLQGTSIANAAAQDGSVTEAVYGNKNKDKTTASLASCCPWYNVKDYGAVGDGTANDYDAINNTIQAAKITGGVVYFPPGTYIIDIYLSELRQDSTAVLIDLNNIVLMGDGKASVIKGVSEIGFDVFQLNSVQNMTIRDLAITSVKTDPSDPTHGCNGISMTNGTSGITIDNVYVFDLPYVVKSNYVDGGKAFTVQQGAGPQACTNIRISNSVSRNCPFGFGMDLNGSSGLIPSNIKVVGNTFGAFYRGMYVSASAPATGNHVEKLSCEIAGNTVVGAQFGLVLGRASGVVAAGNQFISHRISAPTEVPFDTKLIPLLVSGTDGCVISDNFVYYAKCDHYFVLDNLYSGPTQFCQAANNRFTGAADGFGIKLLNTSPSGYARKSAFVGNTFKNAALGEYDPIVYAAGTSNIVIAGSESRFETIGIKTNGVPSGADLVVNGSLGFAYTDGKTAHNTMYRSGTSIAVKQTVSGAGTTEVLKVVSNTDQELFAVTNNGSIQLSAIQTASVPTGQSKRIPVYHTDGTLAGYIPVYNE